MGELYLGRVETSGFRSLRSTVIDLRPAVTVLVGENNGGKSNAVDALLLLTEPLEEGRARRWWGARDVSDAHTGPVTLTVIYRDLSDAESGTYLQGRVPSPFGADAELCAKYTVSYTPPPPDRRSARPVWSAGGKEGDPESEARRSIRHVYLPPLRDAQQELSSGSGQSLKLIIAAALGGNDKQIEAFEAEYTESMRAFEGKEPISEAERRINWPLRQLTEGARTQAMRLKFAEPRLESIARALRARMSDAGVDVEEIARSGLGYANLLYIATVLTELEAAKDADLTLLLVEEPEAHLHPQLQSLLLRMLYDHAEESAKTPDDPAKPSGRIQVVITTHSPVLASAAPVDDLVVLRVRETKQILVQGTPPVPLRETAVVPIARLGLKDIESAKLSRYLDITKSTMLFGLRVILVEGIAEALLLPPFAERVVSTWGRSGKEEVEAAAIKAQEAAARSRFRGTPIVSVDGVDFKPFLKVLLADVDGQRIADKVLVITDRDPLRRPSGGFDDDAENSSYNRRDSLLEYLSDDLCVPEQHFKIVEVDPTLEPELMLKDNIELLKKVFLEIRPGSAHRWIAVMETPSDLRPMAFGELFAPYKAGENRANLPKGEYSYRLSAHLKNSTTVFEVPPYLCDGLSWLMAIDQESHA